MSDVMLAAEFPDQGRAGWMKRVEAVLKGASFAEKLVRTTADGIRLEPLHGQQAGPRAARARQVPWTLIDWAGFPARGEWQPCTKLGLPGLWWRAQQGPCWS